MHALVRKKINTLFRSTDSKPAISIVIDATANMLTPRMHTCWFTFEDDLDTGSILLIDHLICLHCHM